MKVLASVLPGSNSSSSEFSSSSWYTKWSTSWETSCPSLPWPSYTQNRPVPRMLANGWARHAQSWLILPTPPSGPGSCPWHEYVPTTSCENVAMSSSVSSISDANVIERRACSASLSSERYDRPVE